MRNKHFHLFPKYQIDNEIKSASKNVIRVFFLYEIDPSVNDEHAKCFSACACAYACVQMIFIFFPC